MQNAGHFDQFEDHTRFKHVILQTYMEAWAFKLLVWGGAGRQLYFVDGFAGAGKDEMGHSGSPMIACEIAERVRKAMRRLRPGEDCRVTVVAIEADTMRFRELVQNLTGFAKQSGALVAYCGTLKAHVDEVVGICGQAPTLYFLDPFGVKGLTASAYPKMLRGAHNEIFALFSDIGAIRLRGVVHGSDANAARIKELLQNLSLFPELSEREAADLRADSERKAAKRKQLAPLAMEAITDALGDSAWEAELKSMSSEEARSELIVRFARKLIDAGAQYVTFIPVSGANGVHKHFLVHATKSLKGFTTMKKAVSTGLASDELSPTMRDQIKQDLRIPMAGIEEFLRNRFAGITTPWTEQVKRVLLEETSIFPFQCDDVKRRLRELGILSKQQIEICNFPAV